MNQRRNPSLMHFSYTLVVNHHHHVQDAVCFKRRRSPTLTNIVQFIYPIYNSTFCQFTYISILLIQRSYKVHANCPRVSFASFFNNHCLSYDLSYSLLHPSSNTNLSHIVKYQNWRVHPKWLPHQIYLQLLIPIIDWAERCLQFMTMFCIRRTMQRQRSKHNTNNNQVVQAINRTACSNSYKNRNQRHRAWHHRHCH